MSVFHVLHNPELARMVGSRAVSMSFRVAPEGEAPYYVAITGQLLMVTIRGVVIRIPPWIRRPTPGPDDRPDPMEIF